MDTLFFWLSKIVGVLLLPDALLVAALVVCCVLLYRNHVRLTKWLLTGLVIILLVLGYLPLGAWLYAPLEHRFPVNPVLPAKVDGVIVLGGDLIPQLSAYWQQPELGGSVERELAFASLARRFPAARLVVTGGSANLVDTRFREADYVPLFLEQVQLDASRVSFERESRNTYENGIYSLRLMQPKPEEVWVLVTSAGHMPRSVGIFCKLGWPVVPWPVDHITAPEAMDIGFDLLGHLQDLRSAVHEWLGLIAYYVTGKTTTLLPSGCH